VNPEIIIAVLIGIPTLLLMWQQNRILQRQNEIFARQEGVDAEVESQPQAKYLKYWPMLAMGILMLLTWTAVGYNYYDRHHVDNSVWTDVDKLDRIASRTFTNETVILDGKYFLQPTFDRVTFIYNGTAGVAMDNPRFKLAPPGELNFGLESRDNAVKTTIKLENLLFAAAGCGGGRIENRGPQAVEGMTPPK
jgi:hypothetical protein